MADASAIPTLPSLPTDPQPKVEKPTTEKVDKPEKKKQPTKEEFKKEKKPVEKKSTKLSPEEIVKKATNLPFPEENQLYHTEVALQKNVVIVGKSGVGKTTLLEVLKDPGYKTSTNYSFFSNGSKEPNYSPLVIRNNSGKAVSLNIIDTPGMSEIRNNISEKRSNDQIIKIIQDSIPSSVTHVSAVFFCVQLGTISEEDIQILSAVKTLLGESFKKQTYLVFTHSEQHQLTTLSVRAKEFVSSEVSLPFLDVCQGGVLFTGAINGELVIELGSDYETIAKNKVLCLRQHILEVVTNTQTNVKSSLIHQTLPSSDSSPNGMVREKSRPDNTRTPSKRQLVDKEKK